MGDRSEHSRWWLAGVAAALFAVAVASAAGAGPPAAHGAAASKAPAKPSTAKSGTAEARRKAALAARRKEAARIARIIKAAGPPPPVRKQYDGVASFYTGRQRTASGGRYNEHAMTAAHRSLPFGTRVRVEDRRTGRSVLVTITDRGPYKRGRIIDLSRAAARALGLSQRGVTRVHLIVVPKDRPAKRKA